MCVHFRRSIFFTQTPVCQTCRPTSQQASVRFLPDDRLPCARARAACDGPVRRPPCVERAKKGSIGWHCSFVLCICLRVKDRYNLPHSSPCLKHTCVRQVALDKWFPLIETIICENRLHGKRDLVHHPLSLATKGLQR